MSTPSRGRLRRLAADVLAAVWAGMHSNRALGEHLELHGELSPADRGFVTHVVYGVLRHRLRLDAHIDAAARKPGGLGPRLRDLLRIGTFELLELGHPPHAAISEAKAATRAVVGGGPMAAAIGGILATVAKQAAHRDAELDELPLLDRLERRYSIPRWWAGRWVRTLSPDRAIARAQAIARPPPVEVCVAPHADLETIATTLAERRTHARVVRIEGVPRGLALSAAGDVFYAPEATAGDLWVQSGPSQRVGHVLDPQPGESVLDLCAGRGTKTQQIAALLGGRGRIVAADVDPRRLDDLRDRLAAGRIRRPDGGLEVIVHDATEPVPEPWREAFDAVLVDAPCTGLGEAARHPEVRFRRRFEDLAACQVRQRSILTEAAATVRPGGRLVYAVCSTEAEEGPDVLAAFIRDRGDFDVTHTETLQPEDGWSAGFFVARLERWIDAA